MENAEYAARVKILYLEIHDPDQTDYGEEGSYGVSEEDGDEVEEEVIGKRETENELFANAYEQLEISKTKRLTWWGWITGLRARKQDALAALFLLSLPNLEKIDIKIFDHHWGLFFSNAILAACSSQQVRVHLQHVKEVAISPGDINEYIQLLNLLPFFYLPSIRKLSVDRAVLLSRKYFLS